jgi:bifunctional DNA-binding transcriptional regulator/antitoxin component of YhaV-PrlF toxin-antitoxin module
MAVLKIDDRYRVVLDKEVRNFLKVQPGDKVLAIPSTDGVVIVPLKDKKFTTSSPGFAFREQDHEASRYLFNKKKKQASRTKRQVQA